MIWVLLNTNPLGFFVLLAIVCANCWRTEALSWQSPLKELFLCLELVDGKLCVVDIAAFACLQHVRSTVFVTAAAAVPHS